MNKRTVVFISSSNQAQWALSYLNYNKKEKVFLLATTLSAQIILQKKGYNPFTYLELIKNTDKDLGFYSLKQEKNALNSKSIAVTDKIIKYLELNKFFYRTISLGLVVKYPLYSEIEKTCYFYDLCKKIDHKYKPMKVLVEVNNYTYLNPASKIFTNRLRKYHCRTVNLPKLSLLNYFYAKLSILCDKIISLNTFKDITGDKQIIFQSGGHILYYFHNYIKLLKKQNPQISYLLLTFKQTLKDNLVLLKYGIYPLNQIYITSEKSSGTEDKFKILKKILQRNIATNRLVSLLNLDRPLYELIKDKLISYIIKNLKQVITNIDKAFLIFAKTKPKLFITTHDLGLSSMPFVLTAKVLGINNLQIQHGLYMYATEADYHSDSAAVWGIKTKKFLTKKLNKKNIHIVGFPGFNQFNRNTNMQNPDNKIFSILTTVYGHEENHLNKFIHDLFPILAKYKQFEIRIRTHPGQNTSGYSELAKYYGITNIKINPIITIQEYVRTSDIVLSMDTTAILWAMYYHKPLFHTSPFWGKTIFPTYTYNAAWIPKNAEELVNKINEFINNPDIYKELLPGQKKFLEDYAGPLDGKSSERLVKIIDKLIRKHDSNEK